MDEQRKQAEERSIRVSGIYSLDELANLPTLAQGQADNLKIDDGKHRVWLCRCGIEDGMPHDNNVTVERLIDGRWTTITEYEAL
jgi:hypothetical protein